jgi:hypothetical protein
VHRIFPTLAILLISMHGSKVLYFFRVCLGSYNGSPHVVLYPLHFQNSKGIPLVILVAWQYEEAESIFSLKKEQKKHNNSRLN